MSESVLQIPQKIFADSISLFGKWLIRFYGEMRVFFSFLREVFHWMFRRPFRINLIFQQLEFIGNQSLNIILISGFAVGAVFGLQIGAVFQAQPIIFLCMAQGLLRARTR